MIFQLKTDDMRGAVPPIKPTCGCFIAGGAVRRWFTGKEQLADVDVFGPSDEALKSFLSDIKEAEKIDTTKNADTYLINGTRLQIIKHFRQNVDALLSSFDFNVCQFAWDERGIWATQEAAIGTLRGHLSIATITREYAVDSLRRAFKYQNKGFVPCDGTIRDISNVIATLTKYEIEAQIVLSPHGGKRIVRFD